MKKKYTCPECGKDAGTRHSYGADDGDDHQVWCLGCGNDIYATGKQEQPEEETLELDLADHHLLALCLKAHEKDITLNEYMNEVLKKITEDLK